MNESCGRNDLGTLAALEHVLNYPNSVPERYVRELLNKYCCVKDRDNFLVKTAGVKYIQAMKLFLDKEFDVNAQQIDGCTPLHKALMTNPDTKSEELITILLCYGADPSVNANTGYSCFELAVIHKHAEFVQEMLLEFTIDSHSKLELYFSVLLQLAKLKSPFFHKLINHDTEFLLEEDTRMAYVENLKQLLLIETDYLKIILEKCGYLCCEIFEKYVLYKPRHILDIEKSLYSEWILSTLELLLQGSADLNQSVTDFIDSLDSFTVLVVALKIKLKQKLLKYLLIYSYMV